MKKRKFKNKVIKSNSGFGYWNLEKMEQELGTEVMIDFVDSIIRDRQYGRKI